VATIAREVFIDGDDGIRVVGVSHYQPALLAAAGAQPGEQVRHQTRATLIPEPDNPHDPGAVAVHIECETVGYLARDEHPRWRDILETLAQHDAVAAVDALIVGGGEEAGTANLGVFLRLPTPTEARAQVGIALREGPG
jgi:hypothetical protein